MILTKKKQSTGRKTCPIAILSYRNTHTQCTIKYLAKDSSKKIEVLHNKIFTSSNFVEITDKHDV